MSSYVNKELRDLVASRANHVCEYCLIHEEDTFFLCHVDHIISIKHGGQSSENNLAYACAVCNRKKGSDVGSILLPSRKFVRFYNPRIDLWIDHFKLEDHLIVSLTDIGEVTVKIFEFNNEDRLIERQALISVGRYPSSAALKVMKSGIK